MEETKGSVTKGGGATVMSRRKLYSNIANHKTEILDVLFDKLHSRNEAIALGAAKILINKILPDLKQTELVGEEGGSIKVSLDINQDGSQYKVYKSSEVSE